MVITAFSVSLDYNDRVKKYEEHVKHSERTKKKPQTHKLRVASRSRENAFDMGVMASFAVFSVNSSAPAMIVVSS